MKRWIVLCALALSALLAASCRPNNPATEGSSGGSASVDSPGTPAAPEPAGPAYTIRYQPGETYQAKYDTVLTVEHADSSSRIRFEGIQTTTSKKSGDEFQIEERLQITKSDLTGSYFKADVLPEYKTRLSSPVRMTTNGLMETRLDYASSAVTGIAQPGSDFPEGEVRVGDEWEAVLVMMGDDEQKIPAKLAAVEEVNGRQALRLEYGPMPVQGGMTDGPMVTWVDPDTGIVLKSQAKIKLANGLTSEFIKTIKS